MLKWRWGPVQGLLSSGTINVRKDARAGFVIKINIFGFVSMERKVI